MVKPLFFWGVNDLKNVLFRVKLYFFKRNHHFLFRVKEAKLGLVSFAVKVEASSQRFTSS